MRLFIAADIPQAQRVSLEEALEPLKPLLPDVRWTKPQSWHVTLKFLGEVPETRLDEVQEVLEEVVSRAERFETRLTKPGAFPNVKGPRVLWMGLADEAHAFRNLAGRTERKFARAGFCAEGRPFRPHLTLARTKRGALKPAGAQRMERLRKQLADQPLDRSPFPVREVIVFQSRQGPGGSIYEPVLLLPLDRS